MTSSGPVTAGAGPSRRFAQVDAVCLDLDGTLVDTVSGWHAAFAEVWPELVAATPALSSIASAATAYDDVLRGYMHEAHAAAGDVEWSDAFVRAAFRRLIASDGSPHDAVADALAGRYIEGANRYMRLFPEVADALTRLRSRFKLGLISNGLVRDQRAKIESAAIADCFDVIVISEAVALRKPDPAIFDYALERLDTRPARALYAGDNPEHDIAGARAAGMLSVWVHRGDGFFGPAPHADATVTDLDQLAALIAPR